MTILAVDVDYRHGQKAVIAGVLFDEWQDDTEKAHVVSEILNVAAYEPGHFYRRELPCILQLLKEHALQPELIVVDGFVWLDGETQPGLGAHLYTALAANEALRQVPVVGVAKRSFAGIDEKYQPLRGNSENPLYVSYVGISLDSAQRHIAAMAGEHRFPTLLKRVDRLCRDSVLVQG